LGEGKLRAATRYDYNLILAVFDPGEELTAKLTHQRSTKQNAFFHLLVQRAFERQMQGPKLQTWQALKDWLLIRADHCTELRHHVGPLTSKETRVIGAALAMGLRTENDFVGVAYDKRRQEIVLRTAKSVAFKACDSEKMGELVAAVEALILQEICPGLTVEEIMGEARRAA
jgi:hypothetical protein